MGRVGPSNGERMETSMTISDLVAAGSLKRGTVAHTSVRLLQAALVTLGAKLLIDGDFGAVTEVAVKGFQVAHGLSGVSWR